MMTSKRSITLALLSLIAVGVDSFSVVTSRGVTAGFQQQSPYTSTCRWAEEQSGAETSKDEVSEDDKVESGEASAAAAADILSSPAFLKRKLEVLETDIENAEKDIAAEKARLEEGRAEWEGQIESLEREYSNIKDRMSAQNSQKDDIATVEVVKGMFELIDNFERAFGAVTPETDEEKAIDAEYRQLFADILATFEKLGVKEVETVGKEFDYEVHQAIMQRANDEYDEGIVCESYQKGFVLGEKLIRPAMVAVAA